MSLRDYRFNGEHASAIDFFKLFFSLCILTIHTNLFRILPSFAEWIVTSVVLRMAVPYFFICSGYFYWKKVIKNYESDEWAESCALGYIKRNIRPFMFFASVSLLCNAALAFHREGLEGVMQTIHNSVFYPLGAMWFVSSCMIAAVIITKLRQHKLALILWACVGYFFSLICNSYYFIIDRTIIGNIVDCYLQYFVSARNGIFVGVFFFGIGRVIAENEVRIQRVVRNHSYLLVLVLLVVQIIESVILFGRTMRDDSSLFITMPFLAAMVFWTSMQAKMPYDPKISFLLRRMSGYLYFLHPLLNVTIGTIIIIFLGNVVINTCVILSGCALTWCLTQKSDNKLIRSILP